MKLRHVSRRALAVFPLDLYAPLRIKNSEENENKI
jgi:hypothetical protein